MSKKEATGEAKAPVIEPVLLPVNKEPDGDPIMRPMSERKPKDSPPRKAAAPAQAPVMANVVALTAKVRLDVFCRLTGLKFDKLAGFRFVAKKQRLGPMSIPDWWAEFQKYQKRPVG